MRLKSFQAKTMADAMRQVRAALGEDAIIVNSKESPNGWVRITAAIDQDQPEPENILKTLKKEQKEEYDEETIIELITDALLKHRVPAKVNDFLITSAMTAIGRTPQTVLSHALGKLFTFTKDEPFKKPVLLAGPPGAGKTLMAAKLAARAVLDHRKPSVITTDIARAGGVEQLQAFLDILSLPLHQAEDAKTLKQALAKSKNATDIIIDTGGLNPFDPQEMKALARLLAIEDMEPCLVLPAGIDSEEAAEIALTFDVLGVKRMIPTRLDFTRRFGSILSAADRADLAFSIASHTPQVADGILTLTPDKLAEILIPVTEKPEKPKRGRS